MIKQPLKQIDLIVSQTSNLGFKTYEITQFQDFENNRIQIKFPEVIIIIG